MSGFSFVPPARPCDAAFFHVSRFTARSRPWNVAFFHVFSSVSCPFQAEVGSHLPLLRPTLSISTFLCTDDLLRMHSYSHAACIYPLHSFLFNLHALTHTHTHPHIHTHQLLHKPNLTPTSVYTNTLLHQTLFAETPFYTNQF